MYARGVRKRTNMNVEMDLVAEAAEILGTKNTTETVHRALREVVALQRRRELAADDMPWLTTESLEALRRLENEHDDDPEGPLFGD